jgi:hypothetical protein
MSAGRLDLYYECGILKPIDIIYEDMDGVPVDLSGITARMDVREYVGAPTTIASFSSPTEITLGGAAGTIQIRPPTTIPPGSYVYDLVLEAGGSVFERLVEGNFFASPAVTGFSIDYVSCAPPV